jgi:long-subunit acyl-CoA synthetase (AMP-forming)
MENNQRFDKLIQSNDVISTPIVNNIAEMLFKEIPHRNEESYIIYSHLHGKFVKVSLKKLRFIISHLYEDFQNKKIKNGDTVFLATLQVNNPLLISIMFLALLSYGARVFLPLFVETKVLDNWFKLAKCDVLILPKKEILKMKHYEKQKYAINEIFKKAVANKIKIYDLSEDFSFEPYISKTLNSNLITNKNQLIDSVIKNTNPTTEAVIFTTSGSTGESKLVLYDQKALINNCMSWNMSGMYNSDKLGGRSFIDILPHTISIRALINALWTGHPICMVVSDWVKQKPEKVLSLLTKMKPETITMGPSSIDIILEYIGLIPELRNLAFSELKKVVSTAAPFDIKIAKKIEEIFNFNLHNAFGTTETQQVLTTVLYNEKSLGQYNLDLGKPFYGVSIGLNKHKNNTYKLFIKSPYCCKAIIDKKNIILDEFLYTGDIVKLDNNNKLIYVDREKIDFFKSGYGIKIPILIMKKYYHELYEKVNYIEYFSYSTLNYSLGVAALILIQNNNLPQGRITDERTINKYYNIIEKINYSLFKTLEPFEYERRTITRFILVNIRDEKDFKIKISKNKIKEHFENEIKDLLYSDEKSGVTNLASLKSSYLIFLLKNTLFKSKKTRKVILDLLLKYEESKYKKK